MDPLTRGSPTGLVKNWRRRGRIISCAWTNHPLYPEQVVTDADWVQNHLPATLVRGEHPMKQCVWARQSVDGRYRGQESDRVIRSQGILDILSRRCWQSRACLMSFSSCHCRASRGTTVCIRNLHRKSNCQKIELPNDANDGRERVWGAARPGSCDYCQDLRSLSTGVWSFSRVTGN